MKRDTFRMKQFVTQDFCLGCLGCCRFAKADSLWAPSLLEEEKKGLNLKKIKLLPLGDTFVCPFLNPENNRCLIYKMRPFECALYPFLINKKRGQLYLALHLSCPFIKAQLDCRELRLYQDYLQKILSSPSSLDTLKKNQMNFTHYPEDEILALFDFKI